MPTDQQVSSQIILKTVMELRRQGLNRVMEDLEKVEPDLAEYVIENLSLIHRRLLEVGATAKQTRRIQHQIESLVAIGVMALRTGQYELWRGTAVSGPLAELSRSTQDGGDIAAPPPA